jgi:hypothetical protein
MQDFALPSVVRGPELNCALARLALSLASEMSGWLLSDSGSVGAMEWKWSVCGAVASGGGHGHGFVGFGSNFAAWRSAARRMARLDMVENSFGK